jgi:transcriptional regulator with XRE-family HTH domain
MWTPSAPADALSPHLTLVDPAASPRPSGGKEGRRPEGLGAKLRRERERRQITLAEVSERTKIGIGLLQDLERSDVSRWPVGIYRRGFIRGYAEAVGLDADLIAREFFDAFPVDDDRQGSTASAVVADPGGRAAVPQLRLTLAEINPGERRRTAVAIALRRGLAVLCDLGVVAATSAILWLIAATFWPAVAGVAMGYYSAGFLIAGTTPGAAFLEHSERRARSGSPVRSRRHVHALQ